MKKFLAALIISIVASICICCFMIKAGNSAELPDYEEPVAGWTSEELEEETLLCVSHRLETMRTETATFYLEKICYYQVIADGESLN